METIAQAAYLVAALLFILGLAGLSMHETAKTGNVFGMAGMVLALAATTALALNHGISGTAIAVLMAAVIIGTAVGLYRAGRGDDGDA